MSYILYSCVFMTALFRSESLQTSWFLSFGWCSSCFSCTSKPNTSESRRGGCDLASMCYLDRHERRRIPSLHSRRLSYCNWTTSFYYIPTVSDSDGMNDKWIPSVHTARATYKSRDEHSHLTAGLMIWYAANCAIMLSGKLLQTACR